MKTLLTCVLKNSNLLLYIKVNKLSNTISVVNIEFLIQLLNLLITGRCIILGEYHIRWKCGIIKPFTYIDCGSIHILYYNISSISILIY